MLTYAARRLLLLPVTLLALSVVVFLLLRLAPGDPVTMVAGPNVTQEVYERTYRQLGLDKPITTQYAIYLGQVLKGDLGTSLRTKQPVQRLLQQRLPNTLTLAGAALLVGYLLAVPTGIVGALRPDSVYGFLGNVLAIAGTCVPSFWLGLLLMELLGVRAKLLPPFGTGDVRYLVLPALTLGVGVAALPARILRASMEQVLKSDFVRTARSKGLRPPTVVVKHALRNASVSLVTLFGMQVGTLAAGAMVIESVFDWRGIGSLLITSVLGRDYPVVQSLLLVVGAIVVLGNFLADLLYAVLDPRVRDA